MIEILLALQIIYGSSKSTSINCDYFTNQACTDPVAHIIWINENIKNKEFVLYHEIGHNLYWDNKTVDNGIFSSQQNIADDFAFYVYSKKYPNTYIDGAKYWTYKTFYDSIIEKKDNELFEETCKEDCLSLIYKII